MLTEEQIEAMVRAKYPRTDKEKNCKQEKVLQESKRDWYREQLRTQQVDEPTLN